MVGRRRPRDADGADRRLRLALRASVALCAVAMLVVQGFAAGPFELARGVLAAGLLAVAPWLFGLAAQRVEARGAGGLAVGTVFALQALPLGLIGAGRPELLLAGVLLLFAANLYRWAADDRAAAGALTAAPISVTVGFALAPGAAWLALQPLSIAVAVLALLFLQARTVARREQARPTGEVPPGLFLVALPLALLLLCVSFAIHVAVNVLPDPILGLSAGDGTVVTQSPNEPGSAEGQDAQETFDQIFPSGLQHGGGVSQLQVETVMVVTPSDGRDHGPLYLRGMVLDVITAQGATFRGGRGRPYRSAPGAWVDLQEEAPPGELVELQVTQQPVRIRGGELGILFAPERLLALQRAAFQYDADGLLVALDPEDDWFRFRCRAQERRATHLDLRALLELDARHPSPLYRALPEDAASRAVLAELRRTAEEVAGLARGASDVERVARLVRWFQTEFVYDLRASEFPGLEGVLTFLQERRGPCTWYASTAALMLRSLGFPTRIATGFVAKSFDEELGAYVVTSREGHAWIEVHFDGFGWLTLDPTPGDQRQSALTRFELASEGGSFGQWATSLFDGLIGWAESGGDTGRMRDVLDTLMQGPRVLWRAARAAPRGLVIAAIVALSAWLVWRRRGRRASAHGKVPPTSRERRAATLRAQLVDALARAGFPRRPSQTLRELGGAVGALGGDFTSVPNAAAVLDRARFGARDLSPDEVSGVEQVIGALREFARNSKSK